LSTAAGTAGDRGGRFAVYGLENHAGTPVYVHAKVCVIDDVWASVGSDNINLRSWTHDSELSCAIVDETLDPREPKDPGALGDGARSFARNLRLQLAHEHLDRPRSAAGGAGYMAWRRRRATPRSSAAADRSTAPATWGRPYAVDGPATTRSALLRESADAVDRFEAHLLRHHPNQVIAARLLAQELLKDADDAGITAAEIAHQRRRPRRQGLCGQRLDSPVRSQAYAQAPEIGQEILELALLQDEQAAGAPPAPVQRREHLLRWAAVRDRMAYQGADDVEGRRITAAAIDAARDLQDHDRVHGLWAGPLDPHDDRQDPPNVMRAYVRQEFSARNASPRQLP
jgi:hypothetical protein